MEPTSPANDEEKSLASQHDEVKPATPEFGDADAIKQLQLVGVEHRQTTTISFSGPIPPPEMLEAYNKVIPNLAERLIVAFEEQAKHRQLLEKSVVLGGTVRSNRGLVFGFILGLVALVGSMFLIYIGRDISGLTIFVTALVSLVGVFVYQTMERKNERLTRSRTRAERAATKKGDKQ